MFYHKVVIPTEKHPFLPPPSQKKKLLLESFNRETHGINFVCNFSQSSILCILRFWWQTFLTVYMGHDRNLMKLTGASFFFRESNQFGPCQGSVSPKIEIDV